MLYVKSLQSLSSYIFNKLQGQVFRWVPIRVIYWPNQIAEFVNAFQNNADL